MALQHQPFLMNRNVFVAKPYGKTIQNHGKLKTIRKLIRKYPENDRLTKEFYETLWDEMKQLCLISMKDESDKNV